LGGKEGAKGCFYAYVVGYFAAIPPHLQAPLRVAILHREGVGTQETALFQARAP
jgi:hypothetical protein